MLLLLFSAKRSKEAREKQPLSETLSWALYNTLLQIYIFISGDFYKSSGELPSPNVWKHCKVSRRKGCKAYKLSLNWKIEKRKPLEQGRVVDSCLVIFENHPIFGKYEKLCNNLFRRCRKYCGDFFSFNCDRRGKTFGEIIEGAHPYFCLPTK